jgi:hypothetical protein
LQSHRKRNDVAIDEFPQDLLADILRRQHCHSELNHRTINHRTINHRTINHRTINHRTINHRTINHFFDPCRAQAEQQCSKM